MTSIHTPFSLSTHTEGALLDDTQELAALGTGSGAQFVHDAYDQTAWTLAEQGYPRLHQTVQTASQKVASAPDLVRDLFWSLQKAAPTFREQTSSPLDRIHRQILDAVLQTQEWEQMRATGSVGDPLLSAMGTIGLAGQVVQSLDETTTHTLNHLHELQQQVRQLLSQAEGLHEAAEMAQSEQAEQLAALASQQQQQAIETRALMASLLQQFEQGAPGQARTRVMRQAARQGLQHAIQQADGMRAALSAFGELTTDAGQGDGTLTKDKLDLARRLGHSRKLKQIAQLCGKLTAFAQAVQQAKQEETPEEVIGVTQGRILSRVLPTELALLDQECSEPLFARKWVEGRLLQYDMQCFRMEGQGPIIIALDSSGSMGHMVEDISKEIWSKAVALALLSIARLQQRDLAIIHFSGGITTFHFPKGQASMAEVIACADHFDGGGTDFEPWMRQALHLVDSATFNKADVICISDGLTSIDQEMEAEWNQRRRERGMRTFGILLEERPDTDAQESEGASVFSRVTDVFLRLHTLADEQALASLFAI